MASYLKTLSAQTPWADKLTIIASAVASGIVSQANTILAVVIALLTIGTMIPRMMIAWSEWRREQTKTSDRAIEAQTQNKKDE